MRRCIVHHVRNVTHYASCFIQLGRRMYWGCADAAVARVKAFLPLQGMTLIPHVNSRAPFDFAKISALPQDITNDIVCDTL